MNDLENYIRKQKKADPAFANFDEEYEDFKIGLLLKEIRRRAGVSQAELARMINTKKTAISRLENHAVDIKMSTVMKIVKALNVPFEIRVGDSPFFLVA